jgi:transcriptional regulator with XRE-family HTH domain
MNISFAELLRVERARKKKSLKKLAEEIGYSISYLSLIENGKRVCREPAVFAGVCKSLELNVSQIIDAVGNDLEKEILSELEKIK